MDTPRTSAGLALLLMLGPACTGAEPGPTLPTDMSDCVVDPPQALPLHTEGQQLLDRHGRQALLRGINAGGRSKFAPYLPFDTDETVAGALPFDEALDAYLDQARAWGLSTLRVPFSWAALEPERGSLDEGWLDRYEALLEAAAERDMWTIVDFHQDIYAESFCGDGFPEWTVASPGEPRHDCPDWFLKYLNDDDVAEAFDRFWANEDGIRGDFEAMWSTMASLQADRAGVIGFEIVNEPGWGTADRVSWAEDTLTPFYSELAQVVKDAAPDALVFFDGTGLDAIYGESPVGRPEGEDLVFAPHYYDPSMYLGGGSLEDIEPGEVLALWAEEGERFEVPVLIGEYGGNVDREGYQTYLSRHYEAFDQLQLHATQWEYSVSTTQWNEENFSVVGADLEVRDHVVEAMVRPYPRLVSGTEASWLYEPQTQVFELSYEGSPGVTEVVVPLARYGGAYEVEGSGGCADRREDRLYVEADIAGPVHLILRPAS